jgi:hypothetical protein
MTGNFDMVRIAQHATNVVRQNRFAPPPPLLLKVEWG